MSADILYFAYGSNMSTLRLRSRINAKALGAAYLPYHKLSFHKKWNCGSGKCDALFSNSSKDLVWGVVYKIPKVDLAALDTIECKDIAYYRKTVEVTFQTGETCLPEVYLGTGQDVDLSALPFCWYKHHVQFGAEEHNLPADYIAQMISPVPTQTDQNTERLTREYGIYPSHN